MQLELPPGGGMLSGVSTEEGSQAATPDGCSFQMRAAKLTKYPGGSPRRELLPQRGKPAQTGTWLVSQAAPSSGRLPWVPSWPEAEPRVELREPRQALVPQLPPPQTATDIMMAPGVLLLGVAGDPALLGATLAGKRQGLPPPAAPGTRRGPGAAVAWPGPGRPGLSQGRVPPLRAFLPLCRLLRAALRLGSACPALIGGSSCGSSRLAVAVPAGEGSGLKEGSAVGEGAVVMAEDRPSPCVASEPSEQVVRP